MSYALLKVVFKVKVVVVVMVMVMVMVMVIVKVKLMVMVIGTQARFPENLVKIRHTGALE